MEKYITIGIAGHVDHGKTSLVKAITGIDTDRLQEEKRRGLSIESGIAAMGLSSGKSVALMDVPGHTDFLKNTIRGLSCVDAAVLLVAADDGVMPQTREHIEILQFFGSKNGFVVLSKADLVDEETLEYAELEIRELLEESFLENSPIIPFSSLDRRGLDEVRTELERLVEASPGKDTKAPFRLWIDQVRSVQGFGTVVSGTILSGMLRENDPLVLLPSGVETRCRSLEVHHCRVQEALAGQRVGISLHKVNLQDVVRGMHISKPGTVAPSRFLNAEIQVLTSARKPLKNRQRVKIYLGTSVTNAMVVLMDVQSLSPGEKGLAQIRPLKPLPALPSDPFVMCLLDLPVIIGGGNILEAKAERYREVKSSLTLPYLKALQARNLRDTISWYFRKRPNCTATMEDILGATGFSRKDLEAETRRMLAQRELRLLKGRGLIERSSYEEMKADLLEAIRSTIKENSLKEAVNAEEAKARAVPSADQGLVQEMLEDLCNEGSLIRVPGGYQASDTRGNLSGEQEKIIGLLLEYAVQSGLNPFSADTLWKLHGKKYEKRHIQKLLDYLKMQKKLVLLRDKRFLSAEAMEEIKRRVGRIIEQKGAFTIGDFKNTLGYGRTVAIPIMEHLDTIGFTRRVGDVRILMKS